MSSIVMSLFTCVCVMLLFAHIAACMLVLAAQLEGLPDGSWLVFYGAPPHVLRTVSRLSRCLTLTEMVQ